MIVKSIFILVGVIFAWIVRRYIIGYRIGICLGDFDNVYERAIADSCLKPEAFEKGINVFKKCPPFNKLSSKEWERINDIFGALPNPKKTFIDIMFYPSKKVLSLLRNNKFLDELKVTGGKK